MNILQSTLQVITQGLPLSETKQQEYIRKWVDIHYPNLLPENQSLDLIRTKKDLRAAGKEFVEDMYSLLTIIDNKAGSLVQFNAIGIASAIIFITEKISSSSGVPVIVPLISPAENESLLHVSTFLAASSLTFAVVSALLCHSVVRIFWTERLDYCRDIEAFKLRALDLFGVVVSRTQRYRWGWLYSVSSVLTLLLAVCLEVLGMKANPATFPDANWFLSSFFMLMVLSALFFLILDRAIRKYSG